MEKNIDVEVTRIDGELKLIDQKLDTIKNNHLAHLKQDIDKITKLVWTIGIMVFSNLLFILRDLIF
tara:strand:+ start:269 stop:466 length:198 start_codon:yes stop_codon:yes gene_type:complete